MLNPHASCEVGHERLPVSTSFSRGCTPRSAKAPLFISQEMRVYRHAVYPNYYVIVSNQVGRYVVAARCPGEQALVYKVAPGIRRIEIAVSRDSDSRGSEGPGGDDNYRSPPPPPPSQDGDYDDCTPRHLGFNGASPNYIHWGRVPSFADPVFQVTDPVLAVPPPSAAPPSATVSPNPPPFDQSDESLTAVPITNSLRSTQESLSEDEDRPSLKAKIEPFVYEEAAFEVSSRESVHIMPGTDGKWRVVKCPSTKCEMH
eukprot:Blabericola_migrator_1__333@NODE_1085_length_5492_cov_16_106544_g743_i0_p3_GENE_NODE_1085_length_5492_cov_16_106544_g743_i0NODE_1085_length_5492_cov_16_106544_g743_i0_p3_ORF_typecomplete_len258_score21_64_NODE_1085_length_5492_cov_16_106544_g743_i024603233